MRRTEWVVVFSSSSIPPHGAPGKHVGAEFGSRVDVRFCTEMCSLFAFENHAQPSHNNSPYHARFKEPVLLCKYRQSLTTGVKTALVGEAREFEMRHKLYSTCSWNSELLATWDDERSHRNFSLPLRNSRLEQLLSHENQQPKQAPRRCTTLERNRGAQIFELKCTHAKHWIANQTPLAQSKIHKC